MAYTSAQYEKAREILAERHDAAEQAAEQRRRAFEAQEPEYKKLKGELIGAVQEAIRAVELPPEEAFELLEKQKRRNRDAQDGIASLLRKHGLSPDHLEVRWTCPICRDTGTDGQRLCKCHLELLKKIAFEEAGRRSPLKISTFGDFDLRYYDDTYDPLFRSSPRERMESILSFCKTYAREFDDSAPNLLMTGETGLGKTHLSLAIAGEAIARGYFVIYNSAQNIFNELQRERFGKTDTNGAFESQLLNCDLLVIDDLGAEFSTTFTNAALYNVVNTRLNLSLPTIISTNLTLEELEERYTRRISSRLIGEYTVLKFIGADVRQIKSE